MNSNPFYIIKNPMITEESTILRESKNHYVFRVDTRANKREIRDAVEQMFNVKVMWVNTCNYDGKQAGRRGRGVPGRKPDWKKAIVKLRKGDTISIV